MAQLILMPALQFSHWKHPYLNLYMENKSSVIQNCNTKILSIANNVPLTCMNTITADKYVTLRTRNEMVTAERDRQMGNVQINHTYKLEWTLVLSVHGALIGGIQVPADNIS